MKIRFKHRYFERGDSVPKIIAIYVTLTIVALLTFYPIWNIFNMALRPQQTLYSTSLRLIPENATLENFRVMLFEKPLLGWMGNSLIVAGTTALLSVVLSATAGYAISRFKFRGRKGFLTFLLTTQMFPAPMLLLPTFLLLTRLGLLNSYTGMIIPYVATSIPFSIWMMKGFYDTVPIELEYAAAIDGASNWTTFTKITVPLAAPAMAIAALFSFMTGWSEYVVARVILTKAAMYTLPVGLVTLQSAFSTEWGRYSAGALLTMIPAAVLFVLFSRYLVGGLTLGSVKG
ncbi:MAG TPA: carbohydrate ABC transporter permease [Symbiobacteriaceae bacterium]|jgi:arabinogalactan oligomer/maltooligosaccharide transport system permease protein